MKQSKTSSAKPKQLRTINFEAIGTKWNLSFYDDTTSIDLANVIQQVHATIVLFDQHYSRFKLDSWVNKISKKVGTHDLPKDAYPMLKLYKSLYGLTNGRMTPLIGSVMNQAGYDANYSFIPNKLHSPLKWEQALKLSRDKIVIKKPIDLDFGAIGKGYLVDIIVDQLKSNTLRNFCVNAGGDMYYYLSNMPEMQVGLENPDSADEIVGIIQLKNKSICGSSGNRRRWADLHHTIDPIKLSSPNNFKAVWVVADSTMLADGLTTALCFSQADKLKKHYDFEYAVLLPDNTINYSRNFPGEFFSS
jgi:thiamine biosynthesis lipoprotein